MYGQYEHDGYRFNDELSYLRYKEDSREEAFCFGFMYGGEPIEKEREKPRNEYTYDTSHHNSTYETPALNTLISKIHAQTEKAILVNDTRGQFWLPKSRIGYAVDSQGVAYIKYPHWIKPAYVSNNI